MSAVSEGLELKPEDITILNRLMHSQPQMTCAVGILDWILNNNNSQNAETTLPTAARLRDILPWEKISQNPNDQVIQRVRAELTKMGLFELHRKRGSLFFLLPGAQEKARLIRNILQQTLAENASGPLAENPELVERLKTLEKQKRCGPLILQIITEIAEGDFGNARSVTIKSLMGPSSPIQTEVSAHRIIDFLVDIGLFYQPTAKIQYFAVPGAHVRAQEILYLLQIIKEQSSPKTFAGEF